jgi:hypothetical protein
VEPYLDACRDLVRRWDEARPRSQQTAIGWSGMADCRAYLAHVEAGVWPTDTPDKWRPVAGTVLHTWFTHLRRQECRRLGIPAAFGVPVSYGGIPGTLDEVLWPTEDGGRFEVTDWKFPTLSSVRLWDDDAFLAEMMVQPLGYAAGLLEPAAEQHAAAVLHDRGEPLVPWTDYRLDPDACVVRLAGFPVDAKAMADWAAHEWPFDRKIPDDALARLAAVRAGLAEGIAPNDPALRDKPAFFCEKWCEFYTACRGSEQPRELELVTDPELKAAINAYGLAGELIRANTKIQKELRPLVDDARGVTPEGWKAFHARGNPAKLEWDDVAVEAVLGARGIPLTEVRRWGPPGKPKLTVKRA